MRKIYKYIAMPIVRKIQLLVLIFLFFTTGMSVAYSQQYIHPGIDIEPDQVDVNSNMVYSTHAGFVTYAGPAPASMLEKGWLVQVESDFNRDNVPDVITRYTHLMPEALMVSDVSYRRETFSPIFFANKGRSLPYGNGPYVTRNQLLGIVGDSGSPGHTHVQYEIVTSRYQSLYGAKLETFNCKDDPYVEECSEDHPNLPGLFFAVNRKKPDTVKAPVYVNPGIVTPKPAKNPKIVPVDDAPTPELPEPGLPAPDFLPPPPPPPPPIPTLPPPAPAVAVCNYQDSYNRQIFIDSNGQLRLFVPDCGGHFQVSGPNCDCGGWHGLPNIDPCPDNPNEWCDAKGDRYYGGPWCTQEGCNDLSEITIEFEGGYNGCPRDIVTVKC